MIEKMQFLSITGPKADIDRVMEQYLSRYEFQPESTLSELSQTAGLKPFIEINPYRESLARAAELLARVDSKGLQPDSNMKVEAAMEVIDRLSKQLEECSQGVKELQEERSSLQESLDKLEPFESLAFDLHTLMSFQALRYRFGRISVDYAEKLMQYTYRNADTIFYECKRDARFVWGIYFCPRGATAEVDALYKSLHFERFYLEDKYDGTPAEALSQIRSRMAELDSSLETIRKNSDQILMQERGALYSAVRKLQTYSRNFDIRKLAACTDSSKTYYIICFWMTKRDALSLEKDIEKDPEVNCVLYDDDSKRVSTPPVKLRNPKIFKPYEMYIRMYGLPNYKEFDPTVFVALTYSFIFGWMFGDVGQGLVLVIGGLLLYRFKRMNLAAIIAMAGVFSTFFGFMFGSIFGFEEVLEPLWMRPMKAMSSLPMIGRLNTVFIVSICFGMGLILLTMVLHIINAVRNHDFENLWFDTNGVAGLVFYGLVVGCIVMIMTGHTLPGGALMVLLLVTALICIGFKEPLANLCQRKKAEEKTGVGMVIVQALFELIEVLLSYFSNTISFVRIGAFAVSHAAMMEVVMMLAGAESGSPSLPVVVLGNLFVCGMEGLIVGIQVLRLEYYEMFSRFYKGDGREFIPYNKD